MTWMIRNKGIYTEYLWLGNEFCREISVLTNDLTLENSLISGNVPRYLEMVGGKLLSNSGRLPLQKYVMNESPIYKFQICIIC